MGCISAVSWYYQLGSDEKRRCRRGIWCTHSICIFFQNLSTFFAEKKVVTLKEYLSLSLAESDVHLNILEDRWLMRQCLRLATIFPSDFDLLSEFFIAVTRMFVWNNELLFLIKHRHLHEYGVRCVEFLIHHECKVDKEKN